MSPAFMLVNIFSAMGLYALVEVLRKKFKFQKTIYFVAMLVLFLSQLMMITSNGALMKVVMKKITGVE